MHFYYSVIRQCFKVRDIDSSHLLAGDRVKPLSHFGERALSQLPPDQIIPNSFRVVKVSQDISWTTAAQRRRRGVFCAYGGRSFRPKNPLAVHPHVCPSIGHPCAC